MQSKIVVYELGRADHEKNFTGERRSNLVLEEESPIQFVKQQRAALLTDQKVLLLQGGIMLKEMYLR